MVEGGQWKNLPDDILFDIMITRLPEESVRRCRCVCEPWRSFIKNNASNHGIVSDFGTKVYLSVTDSHLRLHECGEALSVPKELEFTKSFASEGYKSLVGYSNGLACILQDDTPYDNDIVLWNPFINRIKYVKKGHKGWSDVFAFAYVPHSGDYKVVKLVSKGRDLPLEVEVYSLISDSWKTINTTMKFDVGRAHESRQSSSVIVKGWAHWIGRRWGILCFDLTNEVFREIRKPPVYIGKRNILTTFQDSLALLSEERYDTMEVWVMKDYGVAESWSRVFSFRHSNYITTLHEILDSGKVIEINGRDGSNNGCDGSVRLICDLSTT